jgi:hypothetical protein
VEDVRDAIQVRRGMPIVGKKIPAQYPYVLGQWIWRAKPAHGTANPFVGGIVVIGPHQTNHFSVKRGLEEIG